MKAGDGDAGGGVTTDFHRGAAAGRQDGPGRRWRDGFWRVVRSFSGDHDLWSVSAGVAFYAWYAAVFGVVFLVSLYGLAAEPQSVRAKIEGLNGALPSGAVRFLADQMQSVTTAPRPRLGTSLALALLLALWSARAAVATLIAALNITFQERESRSVLRLQVVTLSLTLGAVLFVTAALALALLLPEAVDRWAVEPAVKAGIANARWPALALLMWLALATLYRAVRPATGESFALVLPEVSTETMSLFLGQFAATLASHAHAVVVLDRAGWHGSRHLRVPDNLSLVPLPPYSPEPNPMEWVWLCLREHQLSHRVLDSYDAIVSACCTAWNSLTADRFRSLCNHPWIARVSS